MHDLSMRFKTNLMSVVSCALQYIARKSLGKLFRNMYMYMYMYVYWNIILRKNNVQDLISMLCVSIAAAYFGCIHMYVSSTTLTYFKWAKYQIG